LLFKRNGKSKHSDIFWQNTVNSKQTDVILTLTVCFLLLFETRSLQDFEGWQLKA